MLSNGSCGADGELRKIHRPHGHLRTGDSPEFTWSVM